MIGSRTGVMIRLGDDAGVVAVIVALSVSTFLLGFAALAVDLGVAYARKAQLQAIADRLAVATAEGLPATTGTNADGDPGALDSFATQWDRLCRTGGEGRQIFDSTDCPGTGWATDQRRDNGQVEFLNDTDGALTYGLPANPSGAPATATAVRVSLPPSTVKFGFGALFGASSTSVHKAASARIGTPLGMGILPFPVSSSEVEHGQACIQDKTISPAPPVPLTPTITGQSPTLVMLSPSPAEVAFDDDWATLQPVRVNLRLYLTGSNTRAQNLDVRVSTSGTPITPAPVSQRQFQFDPFGRRYWYYDLTADIRREAPGVDLSIWVHGEQRRFGSAYTPFDSRAVVLKFLGQPTDQDPCLRPQAVTRGYVPAARSETDEQLTRNVRSGPQTQLYTSDLLGGLLNKVDDGCLTGRNPVSGALTGTVQAASSCVTTADLAGHGDDIADGLLSGDDGRPGRLVGDCGNGTTSSGSYSGIDASYLVGVNSTLVDPSIGSGVRLRNDLTGGQDPTPGFVTAQALRCPRMAVLPVVDDAPQAPWLTIGGQPIAGFVYFWIDGVVGRGLEWGNGGHLRSLTGYLIKPGFLPPVVAGSGVVGPYLGDSMPKEATLICDLGDRNQGRCA